MNHECPYGIVDLVQMLLSLKSLEEEIDETQCSSGWDYWCKESPGNEHGIVYDKRELTRFPSYEKRESTVDVVPPLVLGLLGLGLYGPFGFLRLEFARYAAAEIDRVPFKGWILSQILADKVFSSKKLPVALMTAPQVTLDVLEEKFYPDMPGATPHTRKLTERGGQSFEYQTSVLIGMSQYSLEDRLYNSLSIGLRRVTLARGVNEDPAQALRMDMEFLVPVFAFAEDWDGVKPLSDIPEPWNRVQMGMAITRGGNALGDATEDESLKESTGLRINAAFRVTGEDGGSAAFGPPHVAVQRRTQGSGEHWQDMHGTSWQDTVKSLLKQGRIKSLLGSPLGPFTVQKYGSGQSGIVDLLKAEGQPLEDDWEKFSAEVDATEEDLENIWRTRRSDRTPASPDSEVEKNQGLYELGCFLVDLGLLSEKDGKYELAKLEGLSFWRVFGEMMKQLDGFPIYFKKPKRPEKSGAEDDANDDDANDDDANDDDDDTNGDGTAKHYDTHGALQLAVVDAAGDAQRKWLGVRGMARDIALKKGQVPDPDEKDPARDVEVLLQLGKWLGGETLMENWVRRLIPGQPSLRQAMPGIAVSPLSVRLTGDGDGAAEVEPSWGFRADLVSLGLDVRGANKAGLFHKRLGSRFEIQLGGIEFRTTASIDLADVSNAPSFTVGVGVKLVDLALSFAPATSQPPPAISALIFDVMGLGGTLPRDEVKLDRETRLASKTKNKFSLSVGYRWDSTDGGVGTFDVQLYDAKGEAGKTIWIPIELRRGPLYLKDLGLAISGLHALGADKDLEDDEASLTVLLTGGLQLSAFELGFIGCGVKIPLAGNELPEFQLIGLDLYLKVGSVEIEGAFLREKSEDKELYSGHVSLKLPSFTIAAMGSYGTMKDPDDETREHTTLFIYGAFSAGAGKGPTIAGIITFTGLALGAGYNRKVKMPAVDKVAEFPLVRMVMGEGGLADPDDEEDVRTITPGDPRSEVAKPADVNKILAKLNTHLEPSIGTSFGCLGVRFSLLQTVDCFALIIVQVANDLSDFELGLLGLARMKLPPSVEGADTDAVPTICYVELQLAATFKPSEGTFKLDALISQSSWVFSPDCKLTGGFALYVWFGGEHKGDFVLTLGGYHPRFKRPAHYPVVPRLGLHWIVTPELTMKGGLYAALTPSCFMAGGSLEASYKGGNIRAWFDLHLHVIVQWNPIYFELSMGIHIRLDVKMGLTLSLSLGIDVMIWGPPFGGWLEVDVYLFSFKLPFGAERDPAQRLMGSWAQFGRSYVDAMESIAADGSIVRADPSDGRNLGKWTVPTQSTPVVPGPAVLGMHLESGCYSEGSEEETSKTWLVRPDLLCIRADTQVPLTRLVLGDVEDLNHEGLRRDPDARGQDLSVHQPLKLSQPENRHQTFEGRALAVHPMDRTLDSEMRITVVRDDGDEPKPVELGDWLVDAERANLPGALWDPEAKRGEPEAKVLRGCLTGAEVLRPPKGRADGPLEVAIEAERFSWESIGEQVSETPLEPSSEESVTADPLETLRELGFELPDPPRPPIRHAEPTLELITRLREETSLSEDLMHSVLSFRRDAMVDLEPGAPADEPPRWDELQILTAQLATKPLLETHEVETSVALGRETPRQWRLEHPLLVSLDSAAEASRGAQGRLGPGPFGLQVLDGVNEEAVYVDVPTFDRQAEELGALEVPVGIRLTDYEEADQPELARLVSKGVSFFFLDTGPDVIATLARLRRDLDALVDPGAPRLPILVAGDLRTPPDFVKALALGADAIIVASDTVETIARLRETQPLQRLSDYVYNSVLLLKVMARACGHARFDQFSPADLTTWRPHVAERSSVAFSGVQGPKGDIP